MNLTTLKYFVTVAKLGSITEAAKQTYVSQSAVSKTIRQLEEELGVQLFDRQGRTIKLNKLGKLFYSYVSDSLNLLNRGIKAVQGNSDLTQQPINVLFTAASPIISKIALRIQKVLPNVSLNIYQKNSFAKDLKQFDFIVSTEKIPHFTSIPLINEEIMIGAKKGIFPPQNSIHLSSLVHYPLVALDSELELQKTLDNYLLEKKVKLNYKYQCDEPSTVRQLVSNGLGIGFIPEISWHDFIDDNIIKAHILPSAPKRTIFLNSPHAKLNNQQRLFSNEIANVFLEEKEAVQN